VNDEREHGWTPLHEAAAHGGSALGRLLAQPGIHIDRQTDTGRTALHFAALRGDSQAVTMLLDHAANPTIQDSLGRDVASYVQRRQRAVERFWPEDGDVQLEEADWTAIGLEATGGAQVLYERRLDGSRTSHDPTRLIVWSDGLVVFASDKDRVRAGRVSSERVAFFLGELREAGFAAAPRNTWTHLSCQSASILTASLDGRVSLTLSEWALESPALEPAQQLLADTWRLVRLIEADLLPDVSVSLDDYLLEHDLRGLPASRFLPPSRRRGR
jgi:hypothetical protein